MTKSDIKKLFAPKEFLLLSEKFHELAEDLEDAYRIQTNKDKLDKSTYIDADILDTIGTNHASASKSKVSQRVPKHN